jgi:uncharacterized protein YciI
MAKQLFFLRIIPPRPTFAQDLDATERGLMMEHGAYVRKFFDAGSVLIYGPVMDAAGSFGMAVLEMEDMAEAERFAQGDPSVKAGMNKYTISPMRIGGAQGSRTSGG